MLVTGGDPTRRDLDQVVYWMLGSVAGRTWAHVLLILPYVAIAGVLTALFARELNVLSLGDDTAHYLGLNVEQVRLLLLALASLLTAAAVAVSGIIGFIGLIVPHLMRIAAGPDHRMLVPASGLAGGVLLALADVLARHGRAHGGAGGHHYLAAGRAFFATCCTGGVSTDMSASGPEARI